MSNSLALLLAGLGLCVLAAMRNFLVFKVRMHRLDEIYSANIKAIHEGRMPPYAYDRYHDTQSYDEQLIDLTKWTYRQFYPEVLE